MYVEEVEITSIGQKSFKIKARTASIVIGPDKLVISKSDGKDFEITDNGEYEVGGISVIQLPFITIIEADGVRVTANMRLVKLTDVQLEEIGSVDIVLVPTDGDTKVASEVAKQLDPWVMIPDNFNPVAFLKEMGIGELAMVPKFVATGDKLPDQLTVVPLENKGKDGR